MRINPEVRTTMAELELASSSSPRADFHRALVFSLAVLVVAISYAKAKPFWFDELVTIYLIRVRSISSLWRVLCHGPDPQPPLAYLAFMASRALYGEEHVGLRLPSMIGFLAACLSLYVFSRRRFPADYAWCTPLILFASTAFIMAFEARSYALYLGFAGLSLLCWQIATEATEAGRSLALTGLVFSLAAGISTHWYFILILVPLCLGEVTRTLLRTKRLDLAVWLAFGLGFVPLLLYRPLLKNSWDFSGNFWAKPSFLGLVMTYFETLKKLSIPGALLVALYLLPRRFRRWQPRLAQEGPDGGLEIHEIAASLGLISLPIVALTLSFITHCGYASKYIIPIYLGVALLFSQAIFWVNKRLRLPSATFPVFLALYAICNHAVITPLFTARGYVWPSARVARLPVLANASPDLPIVITDVHDFLQQSYYRTRGSPRSYSYILFEDPQTDTDFLCMSRMRPLFDGEIKAYEEFLQQHARFYLLTTPDNPLRKRLIKDGHPLTFLGEAGGVQLELVQVNATSKSPLLRTAMLVPATIMKEE